MTVLDDYAIGNCACANENRSGSTHLNAPLESRRKSAKPRVAKRRCTKPSLATLWISTLCVTSALGLLFATAFDAEAEGLAPIDHDRDFSFVDLDNDGLPAQLEAILDTDPLLFDTDGDGFDDGMEVAIGSNPRIYDAMIPLDSCVAIHFFPLPEDTLGVMFIAFGANDTDRAHQFTVLAGNGTNEPGVEMPYDDRTGFVKRKGTRLTSDNSEIRSVAIAIPLETIGERTNFVAEFYDRGALRSATASFGHFAGEYFIESYADGTHLDEIVGRYHFLGDMPFYFVPGIGGDWGTLPEFAGGGTDSDFLEERVFTETIMRVRRLGTIIDTVIDNDCDDDPDERCPTALNTIGQIRIGPGR